MKGEYHFNATPKAPPGSEMMLHDKPNRRRSWGFNAKKAWYIGPCFQHYRAFRGILPLTGGERISDTVRFKHYAIAIPQPTPADRILKAARDLDDAIRQQPKRAPIDELQAIKQLRKVLLGETKEPLPANTIQQYARQRRQQKQRCARKQRHQPHFHQSTAAMTTQWTSPTTRMTQQPSTIAHDKAKESCNNDEQTNKKS